MLHLASCKEYGSPRTGGGGDHPGHHGGGACPGCAAPGASQGEARPRVRLSRPGCTYLIRNARCASRHVKFTLWVTRETSECANIKYNMHISFQTRPVPKHVPKLPLRQRRAPLPLPPEFGTRARCAGRRAPSARSSRPMLITFILLVLDKYLEAAANKGRASAAISKLLEAAASSRRRRCSSPTARTLTATHATRQPADRLLRLIAQVYYPTSLSSVSRALEGP